jgi:hypothetical protein
MSSVRDASFQSIPYTRAECAVMREIGSEPFWNKLSFQDKGAIEELTRVSQMKMSLPCALARMWSSCRFHLTCVPPPTKGL